MTHDRLRLEELLTEAENAAPVDSIDVIAADLRRRFGATAVSFMFLDLVGQQMVRMIRGDGGRQSERIHLRGSVYDQALRAQELTLAPDDRLGQRVLAPVTNRGDAIGLLELTLPRFDEEVLEQISQAAHALAYIVVTDRRFTDLYLWGQRTTPVSLAAEIQNQLLPSSSSCEAAQFVLAGALVPADTIGGDASRGARRASRSLAEQAGATHQALLDHGRQSLATGQLLRVSLDGTGARLVNAGHPWPLRLRDGWCGRRRCASTRRSASRSPSISRCRTSTCGPATVSCSTRTACANARRRASTCPASSRTRPTSILASSYGR